VDVLGLPLHPLVVHAAVVLVPLAALATLLVLFSGKLRERYGWLTGGLSLVAAGSAIAARLSGELFLTQLGVGGAAVNTHRMWGQLAPIPAVTMAVLLIVALLLRNRTGPLWWIVAGLAAAAAVVSLGMILITGHSGATAVWGGVLG